MPQEALPASEPGKLPPPFEDTSPFTSEEAAAPVPAPEGIAPASELTDWLQSLESEAAPLASVEPVAPAPAPEGIAPAGELTDWLKSFGSEAEPPAPEEPAAPALPPGK